MKKILVFLVVFFPAVCFASPFLVCDTMTDVNETQVTIDGVAQGWVPYEEREFGGQTYCVLADLAGISKGNHTVTAQARNFWEESAQSDPFDFSKQDAPVPGGFELKK